MNVTKNEIKDRQLHIEDYLQIVGRHIEIGSNYKLFLPLIDLRRHFDSWKNIDRAVARHAFIVLIQAFNYEEVN